MTVGEQVKARKRLAKQYDALLAAVVSSQGELRLDELPLLGDSERGQHLTGLERWAEVEVEHAAILAFLGWAIDENCLRITTAGGVPVTGKATRELVSRYLGVDEAILDDARRALLGGEAT